MRHPGSNVQRTAQARGRSFHAFSPTSKNHKRKSWLSRHGCGMMGTRSSACRLHHSAQASDRDGLGGILGPAPRPPEPITLRLVECTNCTTVHLFLAPAAGGN
eukprot:39607-Chlamydomonas_euryale.AAC.9